MDQPQPETSTQQLPDEQPVVATPTSNKKRKVLALWLLLAPTALIVSIAILYSIVNFIAVSTAPTPIEGELFAQPSPIQATINLILFAVGAISAIAWLPGLIAGIILLATQKKV